ncbi:Eukaryotic translation initiation factor 2-alpha kinase [Podila verticillata]|nr:Eukaryotic translation initiation factor 2-alpha kinase [Podila verticillata]
MTILTADDFPLERAFALLDIPTMANNVNNRQSSNSSSPLRSPRENQRYSRTTLWTDRNNDGGPGFHSIQMGMDRGRDTGQPFPSGLSSLNIASRKDRPLMRNTTVMTLHSDSESELEEISEIDFIESDNDKEDHTAPPEQTFMFDAHVSSISSHGGLSINESHFTSLRSDAEGSPSYSTHSKKFVWRPPETSEEELDDDFTTDDDRSSHIGPAEMFNRDSEMESELESDEEAEDNDQSGDYDSNDHHSMRDALGSYLLAPMGFDDEENAGAPTGMEGYVEAAERFQIFAGVKEFDESDQIGLEDNHPYQVIPKSKKRDHERIMENKRRQGKLLLVSLLDNFCLLYDQSPERNRKLFYVICKTLSNMGIIDEEYLEEMSAVRSSYQRAFRSLVLSALTSIKQEQMILESRRIMAPPSTPTEHKDDRRGSRGTDMTSIHSSQSITDSISSKGIVPSAYLHTPHVANTAFPTAPSMMRTLSFGDMFDNDPTRYKHDFVEICKLGKGGFASVFKARNKLDGIEYAIKKIRLRGGAKVRYEKIFREIKFLARLDHKNVIRYYSSWLEHADYPMTKREIYGSDFLDSKTDLDDDYDDEYGDEDDYDTNTMSLCDDASLPNRPRRKSIDYFGPHSEQHGDHPDELSMGIVFGEEEDSTRGIDFDESSKGFSDLDDAGHPIEFIGHVGSSESLPTLRVTKLASTDMERTHSASSTLTSRNIPMIRNSTHGRKHKSPSVSQEMQGKPLAWELSEGGTRNEANADQSSHQSSAHSFSALSSSIEEIQRSLPNSYSGSGLGSRYQHSQDHALENLEDERVFRPFSFPKQPNRADFIGGGLGELHGMGSYRSGADPHRNARKSTGQMITRDLTLFIQMQLCQTTLQDYLVYRNERPSEPWKSRPEPAKRLSKSDRFGILLSSSDLADQKTHSTPGSPLEQTCHKDLVDPAVNQYIFRAIVEGVAYIHGQDMIHRDLKPGNIFLGLPAGMEFQRSHSQPQEQQRDSTVPEPLTKEQIQEELFMNIENMVPKIGDFGLVTDMEGSASTDGDAPDPSSSQHSLSQSGSSKPGHPLLRRHSSAVTTGSRSSRSRTTAVGTITYASPEQLARPNLGYDQKADVYSLGIIFFELYHPFSTLMERHAVLRTLRNGELPPDFVSRWPKEAAFVLWLMAEDPRMRPSANEILDFELIRKPREDSLPTSLETEDSHGKRTSDRGKDLNDQLNAATAVLHGLGLTTASTGLDDGNGGSASPVSGDLCEKCKARRVAKLSRKETDKGRSGSDYRSKDDVSRSTSSRRSKLSKPMSNSETDLRRLEKEGSKVKRLEQSLSAMRAENRALLDRIQELEYEKSMSWRSAPSSE